MTQPPTPDDLEEASFSPPRKPVYAGSGHSYTLASLLLIITGIGVFLGIGVQRPAAAVCLGFLAIPAFFRTVAINGRCKKNGCPLPFHEKAGTFGASLLLTVVVAAVSGATASLVIWLAVMASDQVRSVGSAAGVVAVGGSLLGIVAGGVVGVVLIRGIWLPGIANAAARRAADRTPRDGAGGTGPKQEP